MGLFHYILNKYLLKMVLIYYKVFLMTIKRIVYSFLFNSKLFVQASDYDVMSAAMYPNVTNDYLENHDKYGPVKCLDTKSFLVGPTVNILTKS